MAAIATLVAALLLGCGGGRGHTAPRPTVFAAASLRKILPAIDPSAKFTFGGSGALETQIKQGAPADVFAAASSKQPTALYAAGMVEKPVKFATNKLVLIVPRRNPAQIASVADITKPGVKLVICNSTVPCGDYARAALANLKITAAASKNVTSQAADVSQVVAEVALGQADAGFVYVTDAAAAKGKVRAIALPKQAKPAAADYLAIVRSGTHKAAGRVFVQKVLSARGQALLRAAGFNQP